MGKYRGIAAILGNNLLLGFAAGMFLPLIPLRLHKAGIAASWIGVNAAASTLAISLMMGVTQGSALGLVAFDGVRAGLSQGRNDQPTPSLPDRPSDQNLRH